MSKLAFLDILYRIHALITLKTSKIMSENIQMKPLANGDTVINMETTHGTITIKMFPKETPKTFANFVGLAKQGYYDGIIFHRVIKDFMIQ